MKVLGIDPGYDRLGIAVLSGSANTQLCEYSECFTPAKGDFPERLFAVGLHCKTLIERFTPDTVALETLFVTKNQKTAMHVAELRGVLLYEATLRGIPVFEYTPSQIKLSVTGYGNSDKRAIAMMLEKLIALPQKKMLDDEYDAIAIALTCLVNKKVF